MSRLLITAFVCFISFSLAAQTENKSRPCVKISDGSNKAFIENVKDGNISRLQLSQGFELQLSDPSFKIKSFEVVYEHNQNLHVITNKQKSFTPADKPVAQDLQNLKLKSIFTLESIQVEKEGVCYTLPSLLYYIKE
jgi:hypothetical protein